MMDIDKNYSNKEFIENDSLIQNVIEKLKETIFDKGYRKFVQWLLTYTGYTGYI